MGNPNTGDPNLDSLFQYIDERLSELYSIHGTMTPRGGGVKTGTDSTASVEGDGTNPVAMDIQGRGVRLGTTPTVDSNYSGAGFTPSAGTLYRQTIPFAWAVTDGAGTITTAHNLTVSKVTTGLYTYAFITRPQKRADNNMAYAVSCTVETGASSLVAPYDLGDFNFITYAISSSSSSYQGFLVQTARYTVGVPVLIRQADLDHSICVHAFS